MRLWSNLDLGTSSTCSSLRWQRVIVGDVVDYLDKLAEHPFIQLAPLGFSVVGFACHASTLRLSSMLFLTLAGSAFSALRRS